MNSPGSPLLFPGNARPRAVALYAMLLLATSARGKTCEEFLQLKKAVTVAK